MTRSRAGLALGWCGVAALAVVAIPNAVVLDDAPRLYPWTSLLLAAALLGVGLVMAARPAGQLRAGALAGGVVVALQLTGLGVVAVKHWEPLTGMAGGGEGLVFLRSLAALLAAAGLTATSICLRELVRSGVVDVTGWTWAEGVVALIGVVVAVSLPWVIAGGDPQLTDFTSLGAFALLYSLPWGLGLVLASRLAPVAAVACCGAVAASVVLQLVAVPMAGLVLETDHGAFVGALLVALLGAGLSWQATGGVGPGLPDRSAKPTMR